MLSELECGICFRLFDAGPRCPRQLDCKHSFCETCLLTLAGCRSEEPESGSRIICAFCRHSTPLSPLSEDTLKGILPVDEDILVRLEEEGVLYESASDREEEDEEPRPETVSQSKDGLPRTQRGRLWKSVKSLYKRIKGSNRQGCITNNEITDLALMACYMM